MDDAAKIKEAWRTSPPWDFGQQPVLYRPIPFDWNETDFPIGDEGHQPLRTTFDKIEFKIEYGRRNGRPASRIMGRLRDTAIEVASGYMD